MLSLEACAACLHVLSAPNMPKQVYKEELIDKILALVKYHLLHNVLVYYDAGICQANRPSLLMQGMLPAYIQHTCHTGQCSTAACSQHGACQCSCTGQLLINMPVLLALHA